MDRPHEQDMIAQPSIEELTANSASTEPSAASYEEDSAEPLDIPTFIKVHIMLAQAPQQKQARNVADLATELKLPQIPIILHQFLYQQTHADDNQELDLIPINECPPYDGKISVFNSASSTFYAPSDLSGIHRMHREYI
ncbi:hypothetical protein PAXINDRAFT_15111 [Paxillus involutus ATCC 200175]|uniref:Uncharacterized protein n=1 Tax=Paxillus involutus ATCC 200175 TaxID=664439 RepID=A0A0C9STH0_PAXIN|nr:hypothetical protein PAXINDRAFT_15111 [Paxillus involutus ATCC 200175]